MASTASFSNSSGFKMVPSRRILWTIALRQSSAPASPEAVSYTHLDVYKRQDSNYGWKKMGILAIEMEAAALYMNAARYGKRALCICTVSDHLLTGEETTSEERQNAFTDMMKVALEVAVKMEQ